MLHDKTKKREFNKMNKKCIEAKQNQEKQKLVQTCLIFIYTHQQKDLHM